jgi:hypothetical protein
MLSASTLVGILPAHWVASVWKMMPRSLQSAPISRTSLIVPSSLLAHMIVTKMVSSRRAFLTISAVTTPSAGGSMKVTSKPSFCNRLHGSSTALCSMRQLTMCPRLAAPAGAFWYMYAEPLIARLFPSVAPLVKMISFSVAPMSLAAISRP